MKNCSPYLKLRVLGAIDFADGKTIRERVKNVALATFVDQEGNHRQFTWRTIEAWRLRYRAHGIDGLNNRHRQDKGKPRKVTPEQVEEAIEMVLPFFHEKKHRNKSDIYRLCIEKGLLRKELCSQTTFYRFIQKYELLKPGEVTNKKRLAFSKEYANQLWQADTMDGPYVQDGTKKRQTYLIAFIDDASRLLCHGQFFFKENTHSLITAFRAAFYKRGIPQQIYVDNGSIYSSKELSLICARLGILLSHAPVRDGAAKGKIERFFQTSQQQLLARSLDLSSLESLNKQFNVWVEEEYNGKTHSAIGMTPRDRFGLDVDAGRIQYLPPSQANDELFFFEDTRDVKKDNTFPVNKIRYEAPRDLREKKIIIRYDRYKLTRVIVFYKDERMGEAKPLIPTDNDRFFNKSKEI